VTNKKQAAGKIPMAELQRLMRDPDVPDESLRQYFVVVPDVSQPFNPFVIPNPDTVDIGRPETALEGAILANLGNGLTRVRRQAAFNHRIASGDKRPIIVTEGDSWFHFPIFLDDTISHLFKSYNVWTIAAAGDTLENMVIEKSEFMGALREHRANVRAFLFSAGGNDVLGEDRSGKSILAGLLNPFKSGKEPEWYLENRGLADKLDFVEATYRKMITAVATELPKLPILIHGYDYAIPGGASNDPRNPKWAAQDQWLGRALRSDLGIKKHDLQRSIIRLLIDKLNERLKRLAGGNQGGLFTNVWFVDIRKTLPAIDDWADELHPTSAGYGRVARAFDGVIKKATKVARKPR